MRLRSAYSELQERASEWPPFGRTGNPAAGAVTARYPAFSVEEQKKRDITPKQALARLHPDLRTLLASMRTRLISEANLACHIALVRDIALLAVAWEECAFDSSKIRRRKSLCPP